MEVVGEGGDGDAEFLEDGNDEAVGFGDEGEGEVEGVEFLVGVLVGEVLGGLEGGLGLGGESL